MKQTTNFMPGYSHINASPLITNTPCKRVSYECAVPYLYAERSCAGFENRHVEKVYSAVDALCQNAQIFQAHQTFMKVTGPP